MKTVTAPIHTLQQAQLIRSSRRLSSRDFSLHTSLGGCTPDLSCFKQRFQGFLSCEAFFVLILDSETHANFSVMMAFPEVQLRRIAAVTSVRGTFCCKPSLRDSSCAPPLEGACKKCCRSCKHFFTNETACIHESQAFLMKLKIIALPVCCFSPG